MLKLEVIKHKLKQHHNLSEVARGSGLSPQQVWKVCHHDSNPLYATIEKLSDYFESTERIGESSVTINTHASSGAS